jgi:septum site-determining protein MinD
MIRLCNELRADLDWILIDSPAGIERGFKNAISPADEVIVITNPEVSAVRDADRIIGIVEAEEKGSPQLLLNRLDQDMVKQNNMLSAEDVVDLLAIQLLGIVPEDKAVLISTNKGTPIVLDEKSPAGQAYRNIARRILGENVPLLNLDKGSGFFNRISSVFGSGEKQHG